MPLPPWSIEFLRRSLDEVASRSGKPEAIEKIKQQASEILQSLPQTAAKGIDAVLHGVEAGKQSLERWSKKQTQLCRPLINGSGVLFHPSGSGVLVSPRLANIGREVLAGDHLQGSVFADRLEEQLQDSVSGIDVPGGVQVAVATNLDAAIASLVALQGDSIRRLVVHRSDTLRLPSGSTVPDLLRVLARSVGSCEDVMEVGSSDQRDASDFQSVRQACIVSVDTGQLGGGPFDDLSTNAIQICVAPFHSLAKETWDDDPASDGDAIEEDRKSRENGASPRPVEAGGEHLPASAEELLRSGVDLVILSGDGFSGGPPTGILIGRPAQIETIKRSATWLLLQANDAMVAMTSATLRDIARDSTDQEAIGVAALSPRDLVRVSPLNLQTRAERLVIQLEAYEAIDSVHVDDQEALVTLDGRWRVPSRQLCIVHRDRDAEEWRAMLQDELPAVLSHVCEDRLCIDLRWIRPSQDASLAEVLQR